MHHRCSRTPSSPARFWRRESRMPTTSHLERRSFHRQSIPKVFSVGWVYQIPRLWKISGMAESRATVRVQAGDRVVVTQATNSNSNLGYAVQRPNCIANPNNFAGSSTAEFFNVAAFQTAPQFTLGTCSRNPVRGPGLQNADLMIGKTFRDHRTSCRGVPRRSLQCDQHAALQRSQRLVYARALRFPERLHPRATRAISSSRLRSISGVRN